VSAIPAAPFTPLEATYLESRGHFQARVEAEGRRIVEAAPDELQIDIDDASDAAAFSLAWAIVCRELPIGEIADRHFSASGAPHEHVTIKLFASMPAEQRVAWQAALGSDPVRELFALIRLARGECMPICFVEPLAQQAEDAPIPSAA
jgi:hypothetical protein